jgi:hypothetical protein
MSEETNNAVTLESSEEIQDTNVELDTSVEANIADIDEEPVSNNINQIDDSTILSLSNEEFFAFMDSGVLPGRVKGKSNDKNNELDKSKEREFVDSTKETDNISSKNTDAKNPTENEKEDRKEHLTSVDYQDFYTKVMKPFKANGREITPRDINDIISLMQQGANYTKKMQLMAPMRRTVESLNKANIDEEQLNFLIDVHKGDKEAIKKLLEKHKLDPMDIDLDSVNYKPKNNMISDADMEYSNMLEDIQSSLPKIQEIMSSKWDTKSKQKLLSDPNLVRALHEEIEHGRFDIVQNRLELEKTFGRYKNVSDLEAYIDLVAKMNQENQASNTNNASNNGNSKPTNTYKQPIPDKSKAAPVRAKVTSNKATLTQKDILSMSDEDIEKLNLNGLL